MSEAARRELIERARQRHQEQGRRGLRRQPPRPRRPEQQIRQYQAALRDVVGALEREVRDRVFPQIGSLLDEAGTRYDGVRTDDWGDRLADLFAASRSAIGPQIEQAIRRMETLGDETTERATDEQIRAIRATLGVRPTFYDDAQMRGILNAWKRENRAFIVRMADESVQQMMDAASRAVRSGRTNREIREGLRKRFGMTDRRARTIARTEISQLNAQITRERQRELGITTFTWITAGDERVRDEHEDRNGNEYSWDDPPDGEMPGMPVNCLPAGSVLNGSPFINKVYRHWYAGELTHIVRDDGVVLSATPNHPVLTRNGFKPIKLINKGEHVFGALNKRFGVVKHNCEHLVTEFSELFRSLVLNGVGCTVSSGSSSQFHGDGSDGEVEIVDVHGFLVDIGASDVFEKLFKLGLSNSDVALAGKFLSGLGPGDLGFMSVDSASSSIVRLRNLIAPLIIRHLTPFECFRLALISQMDSSIDEVSPNDTTRNAKMLGDCVFAYAILVHGANAIRAQVERVWSGSASLVSRSVYPSLPEALSDDVPCNSELLSNLFDGSSVAVEPFRVVDHFTTDFMGHVYNLETKAGYFVADLHAVSNCRCSARASVDRLLEQLESE